MSSKAQELEAVPLEDRCMRHAFDHLPIRIFFKNTDFSYIACNGNFALDHGVLDTEIAGKTDFDLLPEELAIGCRDEDLRIIQESAVIETETEYPIAGHNRHIHIVKSPILNSEKQVTGIAGAYWDISKRISEVSQLKEREKQFRYLFQRSKAIQLLINPENGQIFDANLFALKFYGYDRATLLALNISDINTLTPDQIRIEMDKAARENRDQFFFRHRLANGDIRDVEVRSGPLNIDGKVLLYSIIFDVTESRRAQKLLQESEEKFRSLSESITRDHIVYRHDASGFFSYVSPSVQALLDYTPDELSANYTNYLTSNPINTLVEDYTRRVFSGEHVPPYEVELYTRHNNRKRFRLVESAVLNEKGDVIALQGIASDITESWMATRQLEFRTQILELTDANADEKTIFDLLARHVEDIHPDCYCAILSTNPDSKSLCIASAPTLPDPYIQALSETASKADWVAQKCLVDCDRCYRSLGKASQRKAGRRDSIKAERLALWSLPMGSGQYAHGAQLLAFYRHPQTPDTAALGRMASAAMLAASAIDTIRSKQALQESEERQRLLLQCSTEGLFGLDLDHHVTFINPAGATMLGYQPEELQGKSLHPLIHHTDEQGNPIAQKDCRICAGQPIDSDQEIMWRKDGTSFPVSYRVSPITDGQEHVGVVVTFHDISERRAYEARIEKLAYRDSLTGLPNRAQLFENLEVARARAARISEPFALFMLDLDYFKEVNDNYGHLVGDQVLIQTSERILGVLRTGDTLSRFGGDEFCLIQSTVAGQNDALNLAQRIIAEIAKPFEIEGHRITIGISIGIALTKDENLPIHKLFHKADTALYNSKTAGRNRATISELSPPADPMPVNL